VHRSSLQQPNQRRRGAQRLQGCSQVAKRAASHCAGSVHSAPERACGTHCSLSGDAGTCTSCTPSAHWKGRASAARQGRAERWCSTRRAQRRRPAGRTLGKVQRGAALEAERYVLQLVLCARASARRTCLPAARHEHVCSRAGVAAGAAHQVLLQLAGDVDIPVGRHVFYGLQQVRKLAVLSEKCGRHGARRVQGRARAALRR